MPQASQIGRGLFPISQPPGNVDQYLGAEEPQEGDAVGLARYGAVAEPTAAAVECKNLRTIAAAQLG